MHRNPDEMHSCDDDCWQFPLAVTDRAIDCFHWTTIDCFVPKVNGLDPTTIDGWWLTVQWTTNAAGVRSTIHGCFVANERICRMSDDVHGWLLIHSCCPRLSSGPARPFSTCQSVNVSMKWKMMRWPMEVVRSSSNWKFD
jgi:hypothetical protein